MRPALAALFIVLTLEVSSNAHGQTVQPHTLSWTDNATNETRQEIERRTGTGSYQVLSTVGANVTTYQDAQLVVGTNYTYRLKACSSVGCSSYSNEASRIAQAGILPSAPGQPTLLWVTAAPPLSGLVASYSFSEGNGTTTVDSSSNSYTGTLAGATWTTAGKYGAALSFDGINDKVILPSTLDIPALPFTLAAWIRPTSFADWRAILSKRASYSASQMRFDLGLSTASGAVYITTANTFLTSTYAPPLNTWTHIAVVAESTGTKFYVNGNLQQTLGAMTLGSDATAPVNIGRTGDNQDPWAGQIDNLRLYTRALSQTELQSIMNAP